MKMRKRDRMQNRLRKFFAPKAASQGPSPTPTSSYPSSPSLPSKNISHGSATILTTPRNQAFESALASHVQKIPEAEKTIFLQASKNIDEKNLLERARAYDQAHRNNSSLRPRAECLSKFLNFLHGFMGGVAIGIQANPEISSLVVGAVRVVIDLGLKFLTFFSRLTVMICEFEDYLGPLAEYAQAATIESVGKTVTNAYKNVLNFSQKVHRIFVDAKGDQRRWTSLRVFIRQQWDTFESEFVPIKEDMQHHLNILLHSVQGNHFVNFRKAEEERRDEEKRKERAKFLEWISTVDFEKVHEDTYAKKHERTCGWLINEPKYQNWFGSSISSLLWCHGKPGIGKSVLASNVLEHITDKAGLREDIAICFAYYNYRITQLGDVSQIIAALIKQLCRQKSIVPPHLLKVMDDGLHSSSVGTQERFISLMQDWSQVFIVFDALDECPERERHHIIRFITEIVTARFSCCVKVFVTSRKEMDIAKAFEDRHIPTVQIQAENIAADIEIFVRSEVEMLQKGAHGKTLYIDSDKVKERVIQALTKKADGMFLWVNLQLDSLCHSSKAQRDDLVEEVLENLPEGLEDTYIRILERIENQSEYMRGLALNCLGWMIYARRPLSIEELQDALATNSSCKCRQDLRPDSVKVILEACGNLLEEANDTIRPIHYSVQEFLTNPATESLQLAIRQQVQDSHSMHTILSITCLRYIQLIGLDQPSLYYFDLYARVQLNQFACYATQNFDYHISQCGNISHKIMQQLEKLFQLPGQALAAILQIKALRERSNFDDIRRNFDPISFSVSASTIVYATFVYDIPEARQKWVGHTAPTYALHYASAAGLTSAITRLLEAKCDINERDGRDTTALYYASSEAHLEIVQVLLDKDADINAQGGEYGNALQAASYRGHDKIVQVLLDKGADINAQGGEYGNALQAASYGGHDKIVQVLLDKGANINAQGGYYSNALQAASYRGHDKIVQVLLDKGADINTQGGEYSNALQAASYGGRDKIVQVLLDKGADINAQGGYYGNALQAASYGGHDKIIQVLLDKGANINAQSGYYGNALQAASYGGHDKIVQVLLDKGANINAQGGEYGNALQAASYGVCDKIVQVLLDKGADINAQGGYYSNALQAASYRGHNKIVQVLLDNGADINAQGGYYGNALYAASYGGHDKIVQVLLDKGADINAQGGYYGNALQAASYGGHDKIVQVLLDKGADINTQGGYYGNALQAASYGGHDKIIQVLLDKGADINALGGRYGTAHLAAALTGRTNILRSLLEEHAAAVNLVDDQGRNALHFAARSGNPELFDMLITAKQDAVELLKNSYSSEDKMLVSQCDWGRERALPRPSRDVGEGRVSVKRPYSRPNAGCTRHRFYPNLALWVGGDGGGLDVFSFRRRRHKLRKSEGDGGTKVSVDGQHKVSPSQPAQEQQQPELPLSMSTSLLLTSPTALPQSARMALAQINATLDPPDQKIQVRFHAVGGAPQLKQKVFKISASSRFGSVVSFLRRKLGLVAEAPSLSASPLAGVDENEKPKTKGKGAAAVGVATRPQQVAGLFCYVNSVFAPGLDEGVGNLWRCFKTDEVLVVAYSVTPAFG
ncbi:hypothetical protein DV736_g2766, partial [Chaetothyriales sp. CBS 134916]